MVLTCNLVQAPLYELPHNDGQETGSKDFPKHRQTLAHLRIMSSVEN